MTKLFKLLSLSMLAGAFAVNVQAQDFPTPIIYNPIMGVSSFSTLTVVWDFQPITLGETDNLMLTITTPEGDSFTAKAFGEYTDPDDKGGVFGESGTDQGDNSLTVSYYMTLINNDYGNAGSFTTRGVYTLSIPEAAVYIDGVPNPYTEVTYNLGFMNMMGEGTYTIYEADGRIYADLTWDGSVLKATRAANAGFSGYLYDLGIEDPDESMTELFRGNFKFNEDNTVLTVTLGYLDDGDYRFNFPGNQVQNAEGAVNPGMNITFTVPLEDAGIESLANDSIFNVYTVNGVPVIANGDAASLRTLQKGFYIINGKKIVVK